MQTIRTINVDVSRKNIGSRIEAVQGDGNIRYVHLQLLDNGVKWTPPSGLESTVVYVKPDGTRGMYNKLADGSCAVQVRGSVATVALASQILAVSGNVQASIVFHNGVLDRVTSFPFVISVEKNIFADAQKSEDYIRLQWLEDKLDEYLKKAKDSGIFDGPPGPQGPKGENGPPGDNSAALTAAAAADTAATVAREQAIAAGQAADAANAAAARVEVVIEGAATAGAMAEEAAELCSSAASSAHEQAIAAGDAAEKANAAADATQNVLDKIAPEVMQLTQIRTDIEKAKRLLDSLWHLNQGISFQFETVTGTGVEVTHPSGARFVSIQRIGGATITENGELISMPVGAVVNRKADGTILCTTEIPAAILALDGYGESAESAYNYVDWETKTYHKRVGRMDLGHLDWTRTPTMVEGRFRFLTPFSFEDIICASLHRISSTNTANEDGYSTTQSNMFIYTEKTSSMTAEEFKAEVSGVMIHYRLPEEVIIDISDMVDDTFQEPLAVEAGGNMTFCRDIGSDSSIPVPFETKYIISLVDLNP